MLERVSEYLKKYYINIEHIEVFQQSVGDMRFSKVP
jgi:hypothetical protein